MTDTETAILLSIVEELSYLTLVVPQCVDLKRTKHGEFIKKSVDYPYIKLGDGLSDIFIDGDCVVINLYTAGKRINLNTCDDLVKEVDEFIKEHMNIAQFKRNEA